MKFDSNTPIYMQVSTDIKRKIIKGHYKPNDKIESVRDLADLYGVNPNTVQKSMQDLESQKLLYSERTLGRFICNDIEVINSIKMQIAHQTITDFILSLESIGLSLDEGLTMLHTINKEDINHE